VADSLDEAKAAFRAAWERGTGPLLVECVDDAAHMRSDHHAGRTPKKMSAFSRCARALILSFALALCPRPGTHGTDQAAPLLIEWPEGEDAPTKYWLSTVDKNISFRALVDLEPGAKRERPRLF
jgi:hypothetical protein